VEPEPGRRGTSLIGSRSTRRPITDATIFQSERHVDARHCGAARGPGDRTLPPLPDAFPNPTLTVRLSFEYQ
jgi:hypothetical protein